MKNSPNLLQIHIPSVTHNHISGLCLPAAGTTLDRSILLDPPAPALVAPKYEFSKLENGARSQRD
jgi:hypothetical protein